MDRRKKKVYRANTPLYEAHNEAYFGVYKLSSLVDELRFSAQRVQSGLDAPLDASYVGKKKEFLSLAPTLAANQRKRDELKRMVQQKLSEWNKLRQPSGPKFPPVPFLVDHSSSVNQKNVFTPQERDEWVDGLAGATPLAKLARRIPLWRPISSLLDVLSSRQIPLLRASWCIQVVLFESTSTYHRRQKKEDKRLRYTNELLEHMTKTLKAIRPHMLSSANDPAAARASSPTMSPVSSAVHQPSPPASGPVFAVDPAAMGRWQYLCALTVLQMDHGLLMRSRVYEWIMQTLEANRRSPTPSSVSMVDVYPLVRITLLLPLVVQLLSGLVCASHCAQNLLRFCADFAQLHKTFSQQLASGLRSSSPRLLLRGGTDATQNASPALRRPSSTGSSRSASYNRSVGVSNGGGANQVPRPRSRGPRGTGAPPANATSATRKRKASGLHTSSGTANALTSAARTQPLHKLGGARARSVSAKRPRTSMARRRTPPPTRSPGLKSNKGASASGTARRATVDPSAPFPVHRLARLIQAVHATLWSIAVYVRQAMPSAAYWGVHSFGLLLHRSLLLTVHSHESSSSSGSSWLLGSAGRELPGSVAARVVHMLDDHTCLGLALAATSSSSSVTDARSTTDDAHGKLDECRAALLGWLGNDNAATAMRTSRGSSAICGSVVSLFLHYACRRDGLGPPGYAIASVVRLLQLLVKSRLRVGSAPATAAAKFPLQPLLHAFLLEQASGSAAPRTDQLVHLYHALLQAQLFSPALFLRFLLASGALEADASPPSLSTPSRLEDEDVSMAQESVDDDEPMTGADEAGGRAAFAHNTKAVLSELTLHLPIPSMTALARSDAQRKRPRLLLLLQIAHTMKELSHGLFLSNIWSGSLAQLQRWQRVDVAQNRKLFDACHNLCACPELFDASLAGDAKCQCHSVLVHSADRLEALVTAAPLKHSVWALEWLSTRLLHFVQRHTAGEPDAKSSNGSQPPRSAVGSNNQGSSSSARAVDGKEQLSLLLERVVRACFVLFEAVRAPRLLSNTLWELLRCTGAAYTLDGAQRRISGRACKVVLLKLRAHYALLGTQDINVTETCVGIMRKLKYVNQAKVWLEDASLPANITAMLQRDVINKWVLRGAPRPSPPGTNVEEEFVSALGQFDHCLRQRRTNPNSACACACRCTHLHSLMTALAKFVRKPDSFIEAQSAVLRRVVLLAAQTDPSVPPAIVYKELDAWATVLDEISWAAKHGNSNISHQNFLQKQLALLLEHTAYVDAPGLVPSSTSFLCKTLELKMEDFQRSSEPINGPGGLPASQRRLLRFVVLMVTRGALPLHRLLSKSVWKAVERSPVSSGLSPGSGTLANRNSALSLEAGLLRVYRELLVMLLAPQAADSAGDCVTSGTHCDARALQQLLGLQDPNNSLTTMLQWLICQGHAAMDRIISCAGSGQACDAGDIHWTVAMLRVVTSAHVRDLAFRYPHWTQKTLRFLQEVANRTLQMRGASCVGLWLAHTLLREDTKHNGKTEVAAADLDQAGVLQCLHHLRHPGVVHGDLPSASADSQGSCVVGCLHLPAASAPASPVADVTAQLAQYTQWHARCAWVSVDLQVKDSGAAAARYFADPLDTIHSDTVPPVARYEVLRHMHSSVTKHVLAELRHQLQEEGVQVQRALNGIVRNLSQSARLVSGTSHAHARLLRAITFGDATATIRQLCVGTSPASAQRVPCPSVRHQRHTQLLASALALSEMVSTAKLEFASAVLEQLSQLELFARRQTGALPLLRLIPGAVWLLQQCVLVRLRCLIVFQTPSPNKQGHSKHLPELVLRLLMSPLLLLEDGPPAHLHSASTGPSPSATTGLECLTLLSRRTEHSEAVAVDIDAAHLRRTAAYDEALHLFLLFVNAASRPSSGGPQKGTSGTHMLSELNRLLRPAPIVNSAQRSSSASSLSGPSPTAASSSSSSTPAASAVSSQTFRSEHFRVPFAIKRMLVLALPSAGFSAGADDNHVIVPPSDAPGMQSFDPMNLLEAFPTNPAASSLISASL